MQLPEILRGDSLKRLLQGVAVGAAITVVIGFSWFGPGFGWYTGEGARQLAYQSSTQAVVSALAPVCAERFRQATNAETVIGELTKAEAWNRRGMFEKTGFGKFSGTSNNEREISDACMDIVLTPKKS